MPFRRVQDPKRLQALIGAMLLVEGDIDLDVVLRTIAQTALELVGARFGALGVLDPRDSTLSQFITVGLSDEQYAAIGRLPQGDGILGLLIKDPRPIRLADLSSHPDSSGFPPGHPQMRSFLGVPIQVGGEAYGNLYLCEKESAPEFSEEDEDITMALAVAAGLAIDKARLHRRLHDLTLAEERERIARDLHASVIQRLFAVGLSLQSALRILARPEAETRLRESIDELDETVRQIRSTIFAISARRISGAGLRLEILELVDKATDGSGIQVHVDFDGPIDDLSSTTAEHLLISVREALSNVVRHAKATNVEIDVAVADDGVLLHVADDGVGFPTSLPRSGRGITMLEERAKLLGGSCVVRPRPDGGSELIWRIRHPR